MTPVPFSELRTEHMARLTREEAEEIQRLLAFREVIDILNRRCTFKTLPPREVARA